MMKIEQIVSSCQAVFNYAIDSQFIHSMLFIFFVTVPLLRVLATIFKTIKKTKQITAQCTNKLPKKLLQIIEKNHLDAGIFLVSKSQDFFAVSIGVINKKIIVSHSLITQTTSQELEAIILHEAHHTQFSHSLLLFFTEVLTATFFFLPIFKDFQSWIKLEFEKAADAAAVYKQGTATHVKNSLKKAIMTENNFGMFPQFSYHVLDQRIDSLNSKKSKLTIPVANIFRTFLILFIFASVFFLNKKYAVASEMEQKITCSLMDCVYECVATEFTTKPAMSETNFSFNR
ncbi:M56 family metallopeptidase [Candidatus Woesebacteria bacterium]|nr:M56 family metallopeptidase [Candidatus Woesebacteria bacterium]